MAGCFAENLAKRTQNRLNFGWIRRGADNMVHNQLTLTDV
ncbi:hypothetical protein BN133_4307 [Cronobacter dublinensis 582]|nr:hypothetical protein BN133_4307 [Cronobacter dublinensis 582]